MSSYMYRMLEDLDCKLAPPTDSVVDITRKTSEFTFGRVAINSIISKCMEPPAIDAFGKLVVPDSVTRKAESIRDDFPELYHIIMICIMLLEDNLHEDSMTEHVTRVLCGLALRSHRLANSTCMYTEKHLQNNVIRNGFTTYGEVLSNNYVYIRDILYILINNYTSITNLYPKKYNTNIESIDKQYQKVLVNVMGTVLDNFFDNTRGMSISLVIWGLSDALLLSSINPNLLYVTNLFKYIDGFTRVTLTPISSELQAVNLKTHELDLGSIINDAFNYYFKERLYDEVIFALSKLCKVFHKDYTVYESLGMTKCWTVYQILFRPFMYKGYFSEVLSIVINGLMSDPRHKDILFHIVRLLKITDGCVYFDSPNTNSNDHCTHILIDPGTYELITRIKNIEKLKNRN